MNAPKYYKTRNRPLEVVIRRQRDAESGDKILVGLRQRGGRFLAIRYFYARNEHPSIEAEREAKSLVDLTGLLLQKEET